MSFSTFSELFDASLDLRDISQHLSVRRRDGGGVALRGVVSVVARARLAGNAIGVSQRRESKAKRRRNVALVHVGHGKSESLVGVLVSLSLVSMQRHASNPSSLLYHEYFNVLREPVRRHCLVVFLWCLNVPNRQPPRLLPDNCECMSTLGVSGSERKSARREKETRFLLNDACSGARALRSHIEKLLSGPKPSAAAHVPNAGVGALQRAAPSDALVKTEALGDERASVNGDDVVAKATNLTNDNDNNNNNDHDNDNNDETNELAVVKSERVGVESPSTTLATAQATPNSVYVNAFGRDELQRQRQRPIALRRRRR